MRRTPRGRATLAPSVLFPGGFGHLGALLAIIATMVMSGACTPSGGIEPSLTPGAPVPQPGSASPSSDASMTACHQAPDSLVAALSAGLAERGSTLSEVYVGEASITAGPPEVTAASFGPAWWVVAKVNGAGIRPSVAVWVTNEVAPGKPGDILSVNGVARRTSTFGDRGQVPILGLGQDVVLACLRPIPEP